MHCTNCNLKIRISSYTKHHFCAINGQLRKLVRWRLKPWRTVAFRNTGWGHSRGQVSCWTKVDRSLLVIGHRCFNHFTNYPKLLIFFNVKVLAYPGTQAQDVSTKRIGVNDVIEGYAAIVTMKYYQKTWSCSRCDATKHVGLFPCQCCRPGTFLTSSLCVAV